MVEITVYLEGELITTRELSPGEYHLGRLPENDLVLEHHEVSRRHAMLRVDEQGQVSIEDLGSTNGVQLDGQPVPKSDWRPGQTVVVKPYELRLRRLAPDAVADSATVVLAAPDPQSAATVLMELPRPRLLVRSGQASANEFSLAPGKTAIGRAEDCEIRLTDPSVSRRHAELESSGDKVILRDLGSTAGTLVNGKRTSEAELKPGDRLTIGPVVMELAGPGEAAQPASGPARKIAPPSGKQDKSAAPIEPKPGGKKRLVIFGAAGAVLLGVVAMIATMGGDEKPKPAEPVAAQMAQDQQRQEDEERRRLVIISLTKAREAYQQGQLQAAIPQLNTVLAAEPNHAEAREMLQKAQAAIAQAEAARQKAQQEAQARAQRAAVLGQQIQAASKEGRHAQVLEMARELQSLDPANPVARELGQKSQAALEQEEQKRREAKSAGDRRESEAKRLYNDGAQQMQSGDLVGAVRSWQRVLEIDPKGETSWPAKAKAHMEQVKPKLKTKGDEKYAQGQARLKNGDISGAMANFREALQLDPWHAQAKTALDELQAKHARKVEELMQEADVLVSLGDTKGALAKWQQALNLVAPGSSRHAAIQAQISKYAR